MEVGRRRLCDVIGTRGYRKNCAEDNLKIYPCRSSSDRTLRSPPLLFLTSPPWHRVSSRERLSHLVNVALPANYNANDADADTASYQFFNFPTYDCQIYLGKLHLDLWTVRNDKSRWFSASAGACANSNCVFIGWCHGNPYKQL